MNSTMYRNSVGTIWATHDLLTHRENDLPAIEYHNGDKVWCINGKRHRELGPAIIYANGKESWYLNDNYYKPEDLPINIYINYLKWEYRKKNGI